MCLHSSAFRDFLSSPQVAGQTGHHSHTRPWRDLLLPPTGDPFLPPPPTLLSSSLLDMATPSSSSWVPAVGSYEVTLGLNIRNALKARKGSPKENRKFPKREVYSIRCQYRVELPYVSYLPYAHT